MKNLFVIFSLLLINLFFAFSTEIDKYKNNTITKNKYNFLQSFSDPYIISYFGTMHDDNIAKIKMDNQGNIILLGYTSGSIQTTNYALQKNNNGSVDLFLVKLTIDGQIIWATMLGGSQIEYPHDLVIDSNNDIWLVGETLSGDFPTTSHTHSKSAYGTGAILVKISSAGQLLYSSIFDGNSYDTFLQLALDKDNNCYAVGRTSSSLLSVSQNAVEITNASSLYSGIFAKVTNNTYQTYFSFIYGQTYQSGNLFLEAIAIDDENNIILGGFTNISNYFTRNSKLYSSYSGGAFDLFIKKYDPNMNLLFDEIYGGNAIDRVSSIATKDNQIFILGFTNSSDLVVKNSLNLGAKNKEDGYLFCLNSDGSLNWSTYLSGNNTEGKTTHNYDTDRFHSEICINNDLIGVNFWSNSSDMLVSNDAFQKTISNSNNPESYTMLLTIDGQLKYSTYFGGSGSDHSSAICFNDSLLAISGQSNSNNLPTTSNALHKNLIGKYDGFFAVFGINDQPDIDDKSPEITSSVIDDCNIEHTILLNDTGFDNSGIKSVSIIQENNCKVTYSINSTECKIIVKLLNTDNIGYYKIIITDNSNNATEISNYIGPGKNGILDVQPNDIIEFTPILFSLSSNSFITIYNTSAHDITLDKLTLLQNIHFSIPQSQFPLLIKAMDSAQVEIVFKSNFPLYEDIYYDTLVIADVCGNHIIPLHSKLLHSIYSSDSKCEVELQFNTDLNAKDEPIVKSIFIDGNNLQIELKEFYEDIIIEISDIEGKSLFKIVETKRTNHIIVPINQMSNQLYLLKITNDNNNEVYKIIIK